MASKIVKPAGTQADEFELSVAQELLNLEVCNEQQAIFSGIVLTELYLCTFSYSLPPLS